MHWREDVLSLPQCQAQVGGMGVRNQGVIFLGPRIKMGIYEGTPTRVAPHTTTGSTDYFGPFVNRWVHQPLTQQLQGFTLLTEALTSMEAPAQKYQLRHTVSCPHLDCRC